MKASELTGKRFGNITVISRAENTKGGKTQWLCRCDCGKEWVVQAGNLKKIKMCRECSYKNPYVKHRGYGTRLYNIYMGMKNRCENKKNYSYSYYGERGIVVCEEWQDFNKFQEWANDNGYDDKKTIERIDVNGNYCPANCDWVDIKTQSRNKRNSLRFEIDGKIQDLAEIAEKYNVNYFTLYSRVKRGIDIQTAVSMSAGKFVPREFEQRGIE